MKMGDETVADERIEISPPWPFPQDYHARLVELPAMPPTTGVRFFTMLDGKRFDVSIRPDPRALAIALDGVGP